MATKWNLSDPLTSDTYDFEINPKDGGTPTLVRGVTNAVVIDPTASAVVMTANSEPQETAISGTLLSQAQYQAMLTWWQKGQPVNLTDDLGRQFNVLIAEFVPTRVRSALYPWKHTYTGKLIVLASSNP